MTQLISWVEIPTANFERAVEFYKSVLKIDLQPLDFGEDLKIIRFQHAIDRKSRDKSMSLTELTYQCGYYDQAHMINDFQKLSGMTPRQYFSDCEPYSDYFQ